VGWQGDPMTSTDRNSLLAITPLTYLLYYPS
jgi:hypothetical protein